MEGKKEQETMGKFTKFCFHFVFNVGLGASHRNKVNLQSKEMGCFNRKKIEEERNNLVLLHHLMPVALS